ncbi:flagellar biosynthesis anti-sigma factor FlgM [Liquorilactobacillus satsumensis]|uniref:Negative regulator of flagellin synthesis n=2 Tax=Liquorilactobacillus satsumensis TaxID=259059 RepID=A0A0R1V0A9_9LACO|nr:flagellar biosynthesis anti-sigma factor FlgM [Liquorilactobacillus satsumensis]AJA34286.1 negative regulator of flagellin synthesis FlgM [Liquorilactobacillus satsumensis]KRL99133.1 hypothetical protein FD50_GL000413 [Liquorilactobacillus satsumensis DSM 16230 = JCM 12392]MCC7666621.1 flagellar biosynthesis anti-sigma factor FlgM [Liquorilactobacillus satsumensis]MCP9312848.1 flagellar biosynthesis anti-sigma factor FlgM [Liquorilactobacillus satsumensis]MCP9329257.1 flagellar biosynthesis
MKIERYQENNNYQQIEQGQQLNSKKTDKAAKSATAEQVTLSENAQKIRKAASAETGVDVEKVNQLKNAIKNGTYQVSAAEIADQMLGLNAEQKED